MQKEKKKKKKKRADSPKEREENREKKLVPLGIHRSGSSNMLGQLTVELQHTGKIELN